MDGLPAHPLWDVVIEVLRSSNSTKPPTNPAAGNCSLKHFFFEMTNPTSNRRETAVLINCRMWITSPQTHTLLKVNPSSIEGNEAVLKMIFKGRSPEMRLVSRTHRVALDWLFDRINLDPKIQIKYIDTKNQLADILTKVNFTREEWNHLLCLFNISHFISISKCKAMSKRTQEDAGEERVTAKLKTDDEFCITIPCLGSERVCLGCIRKLGENQI